MYRSNAFKSLKNSYFILLFIIFIVSNCANHKENVTISFAKSEQVFAANLTIQIGLGDLDSDGDLDAVYANHSNNYSKILLNDGNGYFTDSGQKLTQHGHGVGVGDLDSDGDLDIFITCAGARNEKGVFQNKPSKIYFNNRNGYFEDSGQDLGDTELSGNGINLIDIDNDGDLDAHIFYYKVSANPYYHHIYLNNGKGVFSKSNINIPDGTKLFWGDINGDDKLDIFAIVWDEGLQVHLNAGNIHFNKYWEYRNKSFRYGDATLADFDSDGDIDVLYANRDANQNDSTLFFANNGFGRFEEREKKFKPVNLPELHKGDLNNDGAIDVCVEQYRGDIIIWLNDGNGNFLDFDLKLEEETCAVGDLDGDGDKDIIGKNSVWFNQLK